jgi:predicted RNA-binding protein with PIN domain
MRFLLVDAHSVIFGWPELRALHQRHMEAAREQLIRRLTAYQDASGIRVVAVFDGRGKSTQEEKRAGSVQIFYSGQKGGADQVIERLVAKYAQQHDLTVATNDHLVQQTCITFGGLTITVDALLVEIEKADADVARQIRKLRRNSP